MAQALAGKASAPLARSNKGFSIMAEESTKMARKQTQQTETVEETSVVETPDESKDELARLQAEQKHINAAIREAKGLPPAKAPAKAEPKRQSLTDIVSRQRELPGRWVVLGIVNQANERAAAGQDFDEALAQVAARYVEIAFKVMANRQNGESLHDATWRHLRVSYPRTNSRTGPGSAKAESVK